MTEFTAKSEEEFAEYHLKTHQRGTLKAMAKEIGLHETLLAINEVFPNHDFWVGQAGKPETEPDESRVKKVKK
jgi:hypothetical protein